MFRTSQHSCTVAVERNRDNSVASKFSLDLLSATSLASLAALCFLIFIALVCVIVHASSPNTGCGCDTPQHPLKTNKLVNISGVYLLEEVENYGEYLLAMDIPERAVRNIESLKSETITVNMLDGEERVNIRTQTAWATKEIQFLLKTHFSVAYGEDGRGGTLDYYCERPQQNIINCRSFEKDRNWEIVFDFIFSEEGLTNQSYFITKHVGMKKKYRRKI
eukprot:TRINITY_DN11146_c0_g1_i1.p1 TRINITY_DN11146_c0_g1~~TRINITY_DN11146_c0_g1_i1.p1  ORF type:complete len:220 (-),score=53.76 TRINITY_DN11146_c0_g1_i1:110-769(-)